MTATPTTPRCPGGPDGPRGDKREEPVAAQERTAQTLPAPVGTAPMGRRPSSRVGPQGARLGASLLSKEGGPIIVWTRFCSLRRDRGPLLGVALGSRGNFIYLFLLFSFCNPISFSFSVSSQELG